MGALKRLLPSTLFGRLALLLLLTALVSHVLALSMMVEFRPSPPPAPPGPFPPPPHGAPPPPFMLLPMGLVVDVGIRLTAIAVASWFAARWLSQPIKQLACAAQRIGQDIHSPPLPEAGPKECIEATQVFNQMQAQIRQQLHDRDRFVAAVSHDLRTPLTRLRLRAELLDCPHMRAQLTQDIQEMDDMIASTLDYLRGAATAEPFEALDLEALVYSITDDALLSGHAVTCEGHAAPIHAQTTALKRCLVNLVDNAVRYGQTAHITLTDHPERVIVTVRDHGPGIPDIELENVLQPFYRLDTSRNKQTGGTGLGLAIAKDIAKHHQGELSLSNAADGGLMAQLTLPRRPPLSQG